MKKIFKMFAFVLAIALALTVAACGSKTTITLSASEVSIVEGNAKTITATVSKDAEVTWASSDETIATVADGAITGVKVGTATITATAGKVSATVAVTVTEATFAVSSPTLALEIGATKTITVTTNLEAKVTYATSAEAIATVSEAGEVKGIAAGTATITVTCGAKSATVAVTVAAPKAKSITIEAVDGNEDDTYIGGTTLQLKATVLPATADQSVNWASDDDSIATIDENGLLTFVGLGDGSITATSAANATVTATYEFTVKAPEPASIEVTGADGATTVVIEGTLQMSAAVLPALAPQAVLWSTSDATIATIDENGLLTAVAGGTVKVIAKAKALDTVIGELEINVVLPEPGEIAVTLLDPTATAITIGETTQIVAGITPALADQSVSYSSSDANIAKVDDNGLVTAVAEGTVTITVTSKVKTDLSKTIEIKVIPVPTRPAHNDVLLDVEAAKSAKYSSKTYEGEEFINGINWFSDPAKAIAAALENGKIYVTAGFYMPADQIDITVSGLTIIGTETATEFSHTFEETINADAETQTQSILKAAKIVFGAGVHDFTVKGLVFTGATIFMTDPNGNTNITIDHNIFSSIGSAQNPNFSSMDGMFSFAANNGALNENMVVTNNVFCNGFSNPRMGRIYNVNNFTFTGNIIADTFSGYFYDYFRFGCYDSDMGKKYGYKLNATSTGFDKDDTMFADSIVPNNASGVINLSNNYIRFCNQSFIYGSLFANAELIVAHNHLENIPAVLWCRGAYLATEATLTFYGNDIIDCAKSGWDGIGIWGGPNMTFNVNYNYFDSVESGQDLAWCKNKTLNQLECETKTDASKNYLGASITVSTDDNQFYGMENSADTVNLTTTRFVGDWSAMKASLGDAMLVYTSLADALAAAKEGDTIVLAAGEFEGATVSQNNITIVGIGKFEKGYEDGAEYSALAPHSVVTTTITAADGIKGLTFDGVVFTTGSAAAIITNGVTNFTLKNSVLRGITSNTSVEFNGASTGVIIDNVSLSLNAGNRPFWINAAITDFTMTNCQTLADINYLWDVVRTQKLGSFLGNIVISNNYIEGAQQYVFCDKMTLGTTYTFENNYFKNDMTAIGFSNPGDTSTATTITIKGNTMNGTGSVAKDWDSIDVPATANIKAYVNYNSFIHGDHGTDKAYIIKVRNDSATTGATIDCSNNYFDDAAYATKCLNATGITLLDTATAYDGTAVYNEGEIFFVTKDTEKWVYVYGVGGSKIA